MGTLLDEMISMAEPNIIYELNDPYKLCYIFFLLPETAQEILVIGPFINSPLSDADILEIGEKNRLSTAKQKLMKGYYGSVAVIEETSPLFALLDTFGELIWNGGGNFSIVNINRELANASSPIFDATKDEDDLLADMKIMEQRYAFEEELMQAVSLGQEHKADMILSRLSMTSFEKRLSDPIRNLKNYCIIMNTLLRKSAQNGGVHPLYLDRISSSFAIKIEQMSSVSNVEELMTEMFHSYCRLVRKHSMKNYSSPVQKATIFIDSDLSANLSLSKIAAMQNISPGYLSTVFKKETGKTLTEYVNSKRMGLAMQLLGTTRLQVQTIAFHCGIMDIQYFSKLFKKYTGKTPKEYRESVKPVAFK